MVLDSYLDYVVETAAKIRRKSQDRLLYTNSRGGSMDGRGQPWESVPFKHPSTFDTLAMDPMKKEEIMNDLKEFASGQSFYQKTGRAWKRGYLLYGPPGTGKSSMIAAMANFPGYDIYDLELTEVHTNSELRKLLMKTSSKSIIVIEDIDCSIHLANRNEKRKSSCRKKNNQNYDSSLELGGFGSGVLEDSSNNTITLSGLLNFTDGLWSCCGSERIFVFTTNHIEKLDPALLRSGRMDMHIFMSYCSFESLKILFRNYLEYEENDLENNVWDEFEGVMEKAKMTPADVSEHLIKHRRNKTKAVRELLEVLKLKAEQNVNGVEELRLESESVEDQEKRAFLVDEEYSDDDGINENGTMGCHGVENGKVPVENGSLKVKSHKNKII